MKLLFIFLTIYCVSLFAQCTGVPTSGGTNAYKTVSCYDTVKVASSLNTVTADTVSVTKLTITSGTTIQGITTVSGDISSADWSSAGTDNGIKIRWTPARLTNTTSSGTAARLNGPIIGGDTLYATSSSTYTETATLRIKQFISGTNVTQGTRLSLICDGGINITTGSITMAGNVNFSGATRNIGTTDANTFNIRTNGTSRVSALSGGQVGIGITVPTPTAQLHLAASTTAASTGSLKLNEGSRQSSAEDGTVNYVANNLEFTETSTVYTLAKTLTNTATLNFPSTIAGASSDLTITITGAADADVTALGLPNAAVVANGVYTAWVSAADTITVRFTNTNLVTTLDPASASFRVSLTKY